MKCVRLNFVLPCLLALTACQRTDQALPTLAKNAQAAQTKERPEAPASQTRLPIEVYFSPNGGCNEAVVREINAAKSSILIQAYSFTSTPLAKALVEAHKRGVRIQVILDKSQRTENYSSADFVQHAGIPTFIDSQHAIAHNKIMILDGEVVITGSFNFTNAAEKYNAENLLVIRDKVIADQYSANWRGHAGHSDKYEGKEAAASENISPIKRGFLDLPANEVASGFVSSKGSSVFHKADCGWAEKIHEKNLIHYETRDEAIAAGKKPCSVCKP